VACFLGGTETPVEHTASIWLNFEWRRAVDRSAKPSRTKPQGHDTNPAEVFSEAEKLASLRHPCVMGFYGIVTSPDAYATVSEYICHGSLRGGLVKIKKKVCERGGV
jgi:hypothetical protein